MEKFYICTDVTHTHNTHTRAHTNTGKALGKHDVVNTLVLASRNVLASALTKKSQQHGASVIVQPFVLPRSFLGSTTKLLLTLQAPVLVAPSAVCLVRKHPLAVCIRTLTMLL